MVDPVRCVPDTVNHYFQPVRWSTVAHVPVTYLLNTRDRPVRPEAQEEMVTHLPNPPQIVRLDTGHIPAVTDPEGFAALCGGGELRGTTDRPGAAASAAPWRSPCSSAR